MGFAIPIDGAKGLVEQILQYGKVVRPILGITIAPPQTVRQMGVEGVLILEVPPGGPAANAGLRGTYRYFPCFFASYPDPKKLEVNKKDFKFAWRHLNISLGQRLRMSRTLREICLLSLIFRKFVVLVRCCTITQSLPVICRTTGHVRAMVRIT